MRWWGSQPKPLYFWEAARPREDDFPVAASGPFFFFLLGPAEMMFIAWIVSFVVVGIAVGGVVLLGALVGFAYHRHKQRRAAAARLTAQLGTGVTGYQAIVEPRALTNTTSLL